MVIVPERALRECTGTILRRRPGIQWGSPDHQASAPPSDIGGWLTTPDPSERLTERRSSRRRQADEALRTTKERLSLALEASGVGFCELARLSDLRS